MRKIIFLNESANLSQPVAGQPQQNQEAAQTKQTPSQQNTQENTPVDNRSKTLQLKQEQLQQKMTQIKDKADQQADQIEQNAKKQTDSLQQQVNNIKNTLSKIQAAKNIQNA